MPTIYRVVVSDDDSPTELDASLAGAAIADRGDGGTITPAEFQALLVDDRVVPLPHPAEAATIRQHGESFLSASLKGRYLRVVRHLCLHCGQLFDAPHLSFAPSVGCLAAALLGGGGGIYLAVVRDGQARGSLVLAWGVAFAVLLLLPHLGMGYVRMRFSARQAAIRQDRCPECGGVNSAPIARLAGKRVKLQGDDRTVSVSIAGVS